jgi:hypothetical protein
MGGISCRGAYSMDHQIATNALALVRRFVGQCYPDAEEALLAGSRSLGEGGAGSDHDVILLFRKLPGGAWRETSTFEGQLIETFAHDPGTLAYFCREIDRPSGLPVLPTMIVEGRSVLSETSTLLQEARQIAAETLRSGPPLLAAKAVRARRYAITELAATLADDRSEGVVIAAGAALHIALADFALRAAGRWSATGKAIPHALATMDPGLAAQFTTAFSALFATSNVAPVQSLVDTVLAPYGGQLRAGYRQVAPVTWRA